MEKIYRVQLNSKGMPNFSTAEELVRCKECKNWKANSRQEYACRKFGYMFTADDFCSYGIKESE